VGIPHEALCTHRRSGHERDADGADTRWEHAPEPPKEREVRNRRKTKCFLRSCFFTWLAVSTLVSGQALGEGILPFPPAHAAGHVPPGPSAVQLGTFKAPKPTYAQYVPALKLEYLLVCVWGI